MLLANKEIYQRTHKVKTVTQNTNLSPVSITRVNSASGNARPSTRPVLTPVKKARVDARQHGPCWRVMETGHPSTRAVNSGRQLG